MNLIEKCKVFREKGWTCNFETGEVFSHKGKLITGKSNGYINCLLGIKDNTKFIGVHAHQLIWFFYYNEVVESPFVIDHEDRNQLNNRITNLRKTTISENTLNSNRTDNRLGITWYKYRMKWRVLRCIDGKKKCFGSFSNKEDAIKLSKTIPY
jgi:hypothetical protein